MALILRWLFFKDFLDRIIELMHGFTLHYKKAFDVCIGHDTITAHEVERLHYFLCVRSVIFKMTSGDTPDATLMNQHVAELVDRAISSTYSGRSFNFDEQPTDDIQMLFSDEFIEKLKRIPYPNTKYQALVKLLKKHGYPPRTIDDAYDEIMKQVDNYKQYADL